MSTQRDFDYGPAELAACIKACNQLAELTGLDPVELHQVAAGSELAAIIARHGLSGWRRGLQTIEESPWLRSKRPTFNWLAACENRFTRTIQPTRQ
jgi:hypothetical protein